MLGGMGSSVNPEPTVTDATSQRSQTELKTRWRNAAPVETLPGVVNDQR